MSSKITAIGYLPDLTEEEKNHIDLNMKEYKKCVMTAYNRMIRPTKLKEFVDGKEVEITRFLTKKELETFLQLKYNLNSREVKDAIEAARQVIESQKELIPMYIENLEKKINAIDYKLENYELKNYQKSGHKRRKQKLCKQLKEYKTHVENDTVPGAIFGGKDNFEARSKQGEGQMSREDFLDAKYGNYVSRGDATKGGNPHLRVIVDKDGNTKASIPMHGRNYSKKVQEEKDKIREEKLKKAKTPDEINKIDEIDINEIVNTKNNLPKKTFKKFETNVHIANKKSKKRIKEVEEDLDNNTKDSVDTNSQNPIKTDSKNSNDSKSIDMKLEQESKKESTKVYQDVGTNYKKLVLDYIKTGKAYKGELVRRKGKYRYHITIEPDFPVGKGTKQYGIMGVDTNPDGLAITIIFPDGNYKYHEFIKCPQMLQANTHKRNNLAGELAHRIVRKALEFGIAIAIEDLKFNNQSVDSGKKFNRLKHNFAYRKMLDAIESACLKHGVELIKVDPAHTSQIGLYKYCHQYGMDIHNGAAMVIARRAYGFKERVPKSLVKRCIRPENREEFFKQDTKSRYGQINGIVKALMQNDTNLDNDIKRKPNGYIKHRKQFLGVNRFQNEETKALNNEAKSKRIKKINKDKKKNLRVNKIKNKSKQDKAM